MNTVERDSRKSLLVSLRAHGGSFIGRAGVILGGSLLGQGIAFLLLPVISQVYQADTIGRAASTLAILNVVSLVASLQYDQAIVVAARRDVPYLLLLGFLASIGCVVLMAGIVAVIGRISPSVYAQLSAYGVGSLLYALLITYSLFLLLIAMRLRNNEILRVSTGRVIYYGGTAVFQVLAGVTIGPQESGFLLSQLLAGCLAVVTLLPFRNAWQWISCGQRQFGRDLSEMKRVALEYNKFPKYQTPAMFLNSLSHQVPVLFMRWAYSDSWAGWYYLAWRALAAPSTLLSQAVGQIYYRDSAERERMGLEQGKLLESVVSNLIRISLLPSVALGIIIPFLVSVFLAPGWQPVTPIMQILLIGLAVNFFTSPVSGLLNVKGRQAGALAFNAVLLAGRSTALLIGWKLGSEITTVWAYSVTSMLLMLAFLYYVIRSANASLKTILIRSLPILIDACILMAISFILSWLGLSNTIYATALVLAYVGLVMWHEFWGRGKRPVRRVA